MKDWILIKYNEDDILSILHDTIAKEYGFKNYASRSILLVDENENVRLVMVIGDSNDNEIFSVDLYEVDRNMDFNGFHKFVEDYSGEMLHEELKDCIEELNNDNEDEVEFIKEGKYANVRRKTTIGKLSNIINFINKMEEKDIYYRLEPSSYSVQINIIFEIDDNEQMWKIDFMFDGTVKIKKYFGDNTVFNNKELDVLLGLLCSK